MKIYQSFYNNILSHIDPELSHNIFLKLMSKFNNVPFIKEPIIDSRLKVNIWNKTFLNPIGVAAGLDKNGIAVPALFSLGFGHVEIGTVVPKPQDGNDKPRVWRENNRCLRNHLGFPSHGAKKVKDNLSKVKKRGILGANISKNGITPSESFVNDLRELLEVLYPYVGYFVINVSSPNTAGLRDFQSASNLSEIIYNTVEESYNLGKHSNTKPVLIKISPDLTERQIKNIADISLENGISGIIATNTTSSHPNIGGLSGPVLKELSLRTLKILYNHLNEKMPIISVGGVSSAEDVLLRVRHGATLVQLYTGLVYGGPSLPGHIINGLIENADKYGWKSIQELKGTL